RRELLPQRALAALKSFRDLIGDARAMLAGTYVEKLQQTVREEEPDDEPAAIYLDDQISFDPAAFDVARAPSPAINGVPPATEAVEAGDSSAQDDSAFRTP